jgi:hypothetical protein
MYYEKYKKYKNKYLALKNNINKIGGSDPDLEKAIQASLQDFNEGNLEVSGRVLDVIPNSGMIEGMSNQCFWISIFNYLERHPKANTLDVRSVRDLRNSVGLGPNTENVQFDEDDPIFQTALENLTGIFDLQIVVHFINAHGNPIIHRDVRGERKEREVIRTINENGRNIVHITQHGLYHFQYMVESGVRGIGAGDNGVLIGDKFYKDKKIEDITDITTIIEVYEEEIKKLNELKNKLSNEFTTVGVSPSLIETILISYNDEIDKINKQIKKYEDLIYSSNRKLKESNDDFDSKVLEYIEEHFKAMEQMKKK